MRKYVTLTDLYLDYRYKYRDLNSKSVPMWPYVPKDEISDHKYKLTKNEWKEIMRCYIKHVIKYLMEGQPFKIPHGLGVIQMRKSKSYPPDRKKSKEYKQLIVFKNDHTDGYRPLFKWYRNIKTGCYFRFKNYYKFNLANWVWGEVSKQIFKSPHIIYKFNDV